MIKGEIGSELFLKDPDKYYYIITSTRTLHLESYMGNSVIATTSKENSFKFKDKKTATEIAEKYGGRSISQYDWWN